MGDYDEQKDIDAEGQRAAIYYAKKRDTVSNAHYAGGNRFVRADLHTAVVAERDALRAKVERLRKATARAIDHLDEGMGLEARRCLRIAIGDSKP